MKRTAATLRRRACALAAPALLAAGCSSMPGYLAPDETAPAARRVLLPAPEAHMFELSLGGVPEKVYVWGDQARSAIAAAVRGEIAARAGMQALDLPALSAEEQAALDLHMAMFRRVADQIAAIRAQNDASWKAREKDFDFTIGSGLAAFGERSGADTMLVVDAMDFVSSPGRRAAFVLTTLLFLLPVLPPGNSYVQAGLVDLRSGRVLWFGRDYTLGSSDLREPEAAAKLVASVFATLPGKAQP